MILSCIKLSYSCVCLTEHCSLPGHNCCFSTHDVPRAAHSAFGHPLPRSAITTITTEDVPRFGAGLDGAFVPPRAAGIIHGFYSLNSMAVSIWYLLEQIPKECMDGRSPALEDKYFFVYSVRIGSHMWDRCTWLVPLWLGFIVETF